MSLRSSLKKFGRKTAKIRVKVGRIATPLIAAGASTIGGAAAGAAVTAAGAQFAYYNRATQARNEGKFGRSARSLGRGERKRVAIYGAAGTGAGMLASGIYSAASGATFGQSVGSGLFGQGGQSVIFGREGTIFATPPVNTGSSVPGLVTQADLNAILHGGSSEASTASSTAGWGAKAGTATGKLASSIDELLQKAKADKKKDRETGSSENEHLLDQLLGMGGGGGSAGDAGSGGGLGSFFNSPAEGKMSPALIAALAVGAFLLLA